MCFFSRPSTPPAPEPEPEDSAIEEPADQVVVGDKKKKKKNKTADSLKIAKQKETKNFSNPTIATAQKLTQTKSKTLI